MCKLNLRLNLVVHMGEIFELGMVICFGISWPLSVYKSYKARTTLGKSHFRIIYLDWLCQCDHRKTHDPKYYLCVFLLYPQHRYGVH